MCTSSISFPQEIASSTPSSSQRFKAISAESIILAGGMTRQLAEEFIGKNLIDLAAFGQPFIANPDLVERMQNEWPLTTPHRESYYGGGAEGYLDYPRFAAANA